MSTDKFKRIDGELHKWSAIPCPDGLDGCVVAHYGWIPVYPVHRQKKLFEELRDVGFRTQGLKGAIQNEGTTYSQEEIDEWEIISKDCIRELTLLRYEVVEFMEKNRKE